MRHIAKFFILTLMLAFAPAPSLAQTVSGAEAMKAVTGNTLAGKIDGEDNAYFFSPDGRLVMLEGADQTQGKWEWRGARLCLLIEDEDDECYTLEVSGDAATLREDANNAYRLTIEKGNSKNLSLAGK